MQTSKSVILHRQIELQSDQLAIAVAQVGLMHSYVPGGSNWEESGLLLQIKMGLKGATIS